MSHLDSRGVVLKEGQKVAFNRSGNVISGTIAAINKRSIRIIPDDPWNTGYGSMKGYSSVRVWGTSVPTLLVLEDPRSEAMEQDLVDMQEHINMLQEKIDAASRARALLSIEYEGDAS